MYEYDLAMARYYDQAMLGLDGDVQFFVEEAQKTGSPVLELGCGTGRITIPIAESGIQVVGMDVSTAMLDVFRRKMGSLSPEVRNRITLQEGDMRGFSAGRRFELVIITFRPFQHMLTVDDQKRALRCVYDHLTDHGRLVFNAFDPRLDIISKHMRGATVDPLNRREFVDRETGRRVARTNRVSYEPETQIAVCDFVYETLDDQGEVASRECVSLTLRWVYRYEMEHLLELCGFEVEALYGDFHRGPFKYGGEQIWVCRRS